MVSAGATAVRDEEQSPVVAARVAGHRDRGTSVPADASAVVLNVAGTEATRAGYVTVWPCGQPRPTTSNLNLTDGGTDANLVVTEVGANGTVCLYTEHGTHLIADINGYFPATTG